MGETVRGFDPVRGSGVAVRLAADGTIASVEPAGADPDGLWLAPGLVDLQVNGFRGHDLNDGRLVPATVSALAGALLAEGVTRFLPTLITASAGSLDAALAAIRRAVETDARVALMVRGVHVEGPFIDPTDGPRGAHPAEHVRPPDTAELDRWQKASGGRVRMVTLSPHWPSAPEFIRAAVAGGVVVAIGHTGASPTEVGRAVEAGAQLSTHLGNGASAMLPRHPNLIWTQLAEDRLTATLIADGHHLPAETLTVMLRAKGPDRAVLVSDVTALGGMAPGVYHQPIGAEVELAANGRLSIRGTPYLAGAAISLSACLGRAAHMTGLGLGALIPQATRNPARVLGLDAVLEPGARADLFLASGGRDGQPVAVEAVWLAGERVA